MSIGTDIGGVEKSSIQFIKFLVSQGHKVDLYFWRKPGALFHLFPKNVNIITARLYPGKFKLTPNPIDWIWYIICRLCNLFNNPTCAFKKFPVDNYDIAIAYSNYGYSPHYVINKVKAARKVLFYHHGTYDSTGSKKRADEYYYSQYDSIVTVSEATKTMLTDHFRYLMGKIQVIKNLVDESEIMRLSQVSIDYDIKSLIFCTVGRVTPEKGQILAVEAAKELKKRGLNFQWWFVGDGIDLLKCKELCYRYGLENECIFFGAKTNPYPYMQRCNIYVQPSHIEADPISIKECLILHKKIVATNIAAIQEILAYGKYGKLVDASAKDIADAIQNEIDHPSQFEYPDANCINEQSILKLKDLLS